MSTTTDAKNAEFEVLRPILGERFVLSKTQLAVCVWFAVFFVYLNYIPLFHSDIWCHVNYGSWMLDNGKLPSEDPFLPLASGVRVVNTAWLSQLIFAGAERIGGPQAIANVFAITVLASFALYTRAFYLISGRKSLAMLGMFLVLAMGWTRHAIVRPEIFGGLLTATLFWLLLRVDPWRSRTAAFADDDSKATFPRYFWIVLPLLFALWANLHGSFAVGLMVIACHAIGVTSVSAWQHRSFQDVVGDAKVRNWVWMAELCVAATLLNPYGVDLLIETARFGRNPNLRDVLEWHSLSLVDFEGIQFLFAVAITLFIVRFSRRPFHPAEVILMGVLTFLMASTVRMIGWLAPIWTISMMPHLTDIWKRIEPSAIAWFESMRGEPDTTLEGEEEGESLVWNPPPHTYTLIAGLVCWCAFALSPVSQDILGAKPRPLSQVLSKGTPSGVTEFLTENPPEGMVWGPQWWGDWLAWDGPEQMQVFMTTTLHLAPHHVWRDYMRIAHADPGWQLALDRYAVKTIVMDKELQPVMHRAVRRSANWTKIYEDDRGVIYRRSHLVVPDLEPIEIPKADEANPDKAKSDDAAAKQEMESEDKTETKSKTEPQSDAVKEPKE